MTKSWNILSIVVFLVVLWSPVLADGPNYSRTTELPPMRITYEQLQSILDTSVALMASANASAEIGSFETQMKLEYDGAEVTIAGHQLRVANARLPDLATTFTYTATVSPRDEMPVSTISLSFRDYDRELTVEGRSPEQVGAIFESLKSDFVDYSSFFGGTSFRNLAGSVIFFLLVVPLIGLSGEVIFGRQLRLILPLLFCAVFLIVFLNVPFDQFLAGFSVSQDDPSFAKRYGAELTILSIVISLAVIPLSYFLSRRKNQEGSGD